MNLQKVIETEYKNVESKNSPHLLFEKNKEVEKILFEYNAFKECNCDPVTNPLPMSIRSEINKIIQRISHINYSPQDITAVCTYLEITKPTEELAIGTFLSKLINAQYEKTRYTGEYTLLVNHFDPPLVYIGLENFGAHIVVYGNVGNSCGREMRSGILQIKGDAKRNCGDSLRGGDIFVENAGDCLGFLMNGGEIHVSKNAGKDVADMMHAGKLFIDGDYENLSLTTHMARLFQVYHKGKRIFW